MTLARASGSTVTPLAFESGVLKGNPLGDPHAREIPVYLPRSYFHQPGRRYPVIYLLAGFGGRGASFLNVAPWSETIKQRLDRLGLVESIVVMPDCFTALGGSQYVNSAATGNYEDHLVRELVPYVDGHYRTLSGAGARAVAGVSSGGYGALVMGMRHPNVFGLVACHSADMYFELCYKPLFAAYLHQIARFGNGGRFLREFRRMPDRARSEVRPIIFTIALAACFSPRKGRAPFELPFDETTGELKERVWREWLKHDPVHMVARYAGNLRKLRLLYLDCGTRDEHNLLYGARIFAGRLRAKRISFVYEEHQGGHENISWRLDRSLSLISKAFSTAAGARR